MHMYTQMYQWYFLDKFTDILEEEQKHEWKFSCILLIHIVKIKDYSMHLKTSLCK